MNLNCPIIGEATNYRIGDWVFWSRADSEIHVANELIENDEDRAIIEQRYILGEPCPYYNDAYHAFLKSEGGMKVYIVTHFNLAGEMALRGVFGTFKAADDFIARQDEPSQFELNEMEVQ